MFLQVFSIPAFSLFSGVPTNIEKVERGQNETVSDHLHSGQIRYSGYTLCYGIVEKHCPTQVNTEDLLLGSKYT